MGIKGIISLLALGGIAGAGLYFKDNIKDAFATGKGTAENIKDKLQDGYPGGSGDVQDIDPLPDNNSNNKDNNGKDNNGKGDNGTNTEIIYIPIYQNNGQQSTQDTTVKENNKSNPTIQQYVKHDKKKTESSINNTFTSPWARTNTKDYSKQKYGVDYDLLKSGAEKSESRRTVDEKKQIEAEKAKQVFDSRSINNW